jgi:hypothetical protein
MKNASAVILAFAIAILPISNASSQNLSASIPALQGSSIQPGYSQGPPAIPADFSGDWYWVTGGPYLQITLERSSLYRGEETSVFLTITNIGRVESFRVNQQPEPTRRDEILAAQKELQLEAQRTTAQDVSVKLVAVNASALKIKREVSYAGSLREGQVSSRLEFPVEIYENTEPGNYDLDAVLDYTYQRDVAVKSHTDSPDNPDIFYWYDSASQTIPLTLHIEKKSLVDLKALKTSPESFSIGSKNNILKVVIQNQGTDAAKDLVARLRPEAGIYVDMDESPIPALQPGDKSELVYKVDVSKDAVVGKLYRFTMLFDYSDSYRKNLQDSDNIYVNIKPSLTDRYWWMVAIVAAIIAFAVVYAIRRKRSNAGH